MIDAKGREKFFVGEMQVRIKLDEKVTFSESDDMFLHARLLEERLKKLVKEIHVLQHAEVSVSIGSYTCGTVEFLKESGVM